MQTDGLVRLIWEVDSLGYKIVKQRERHPNAAGDTVEKDYIVPLGGKPKPIEAGLLQYPVFIDLANSAQRRGQEGVLEFVNKWGQLTRSSPYLRHSVEGFERLRGLLLGGLRRNPHRWMMRVAMFTSRRSKIADVGQLGFGPLHTRLGLKKGGPRLLLVADSLLQFCLLELQQARDGGIDVLPCGACGRILPLHKLGRPKMYCHDACKMAAWRKKHRNQIVAPAPTKD